MTRFTDAPAAGQTLMLKRAPLFLGVVEDTPWPEQSFESTVLR